MHVETGHRPDDDLLKDLHEEGFQNPLLFRTCAQLRIDLAAGRNGAVIPAGEQFEELVQWLRSGLNRLEIESIKTRGVDQLLEKLRQTLLAAAPPDLEASALAVASGWSNILGEETTATAEILLNTLEPYQKEIEHFFTLQGQRRFRGLMAAYLHLITKIRYLGSRLRQGVSLLPRTQTPATEAAPSWDLTTFMKACSAVAGDRHLDARCRALPDRLLVEGSQQGFPLPLLSEPTEAAAHIEWRLKYGQVLAEILQQVQGEWSEPVGWRRWLQIAFVWAADWLPGITFLGACINLLRLYFLSDKSIQLFDVLVPFIIVLFLLIVLHMLMLLLMPMRLAFHSQRFSSATHQANSRGAGHHLWIHSRRSCRQAGSGTQADRRLDRRMPPALGLAWRARTGSRRAIALWALKGQIEMAAGKWITDLPPGTSYVDAARHVLTVRLETVRHFLDSTLGQVDKDLEFVHQLRVGTRRARAALDVFDDCLPRKIARKTNRCLRKLRRAAGHVRDWDVFLLGLHGHRDNKNRRLRPALDLINGLARSSARCCPDQTCRGQLGSALCIRAPHHQGFVGPETARRRGSRPLGRCGVALFIGTNR